jgi:dTDP-4-dehydrorhamnose 3,5-epimerase
MIFQSTKIPGVFLIEPERLSDERGFFARTWCREAFLAHGLNSELAQCSVSFNTRCGTLRGMHYQKPPYAEDKLVRCTRGAIYDVALDLREDSPAYKEWVAVELTADNLSMIYIPKGCAHGFQTLEDQTEVSYAISESYHPEASRGYRYNDPSFQIVWPLFELRIVSDKDLNYQDFEQ